MSGGNPGAPASAAKARIYLLRDAKGMMKQTNHVANASVKFTLCAVVRAWAALEDEDDDRRGHLGLHLVTSRIFGNIRRAKHREPQRYCPFG